MASATTPTLPVLGTPRTVDEYNRMISRMSDRMVVISYSAMWCPPCKAFAPTLKKLAEAYAPTGKVGFIVVDIDELKELNDVKNIREVPMFKLIRKGVVLAQFSGANETKVREAIEKYK